MSTEVQVKVENARRTAIKEKIARARMFTALKGGPREKVAAARINYFLATQGLEADKVLPLVKDAGIGSAVGKGISAVKGVAGKGVEAAKGLAGRGGEAAKGGAKAVADAAKGAAGKAVEGAKGGAKAVERGARKGVAAAGEQAIIHPEAAAALAGGAGGGALGAGYGALSDDTSVLGGALGGAALGAGGVAGGGAAARAISSGLAGEGILSSLARAKAYLAASRLGGGRLQEAAGAVERGIGAAGAAPAQAARAAGGRMLQAHPLMGGAQRNIAEMEARLGPLFENMPEAMKARLIAGQAPFAG